MLVISVTKEPLRAEQNQQIRYHPYHDDGPLGVFVQKAMVEVHNGSLTVTVPIGGDSQIGDAGSALEDGLKVEDWYPVQTFVTPYRHEGKRRWH